MTRFSIVVLLISVLLFLSVFYGSMHGYFVAPSFSIEIIIFLFFSTLGFYFFLLKKIAHNPQDFIGAFLLTLVLRFLVFAGFMLVIILIDKPESSNNALFFMIAYVIFTVVEVAFLYRKVMSAKSAK